MGKEIGRSFKYNQSKILTPTLKKPVLSSSAAHTLYASNSTQTSISSQLDNKDITKNQVEMRWMFVSNYLHIMYEQLKMIKQAS